MKKVITQEDKNKLLLQDLCARLPHKTYVKTENGIGYVYAINTSEPIELSVANDSEYWSEVFNIDKIKPYLRPMSSMTEEEKREYNSFIGGQQPYDSDYSAYPKEHKYIYERDVVNLVNWLNSHYFDFQGLIPLGLAIAVTKENNPYKRRISYEKQI